MSTGKVVMLIFLQVKGLRKYILFVSLFRCSGLSEMYIHILTELLVSQALFLGVHNTCILRKLLLASVALVVTPVHVIFGCIQARGICSLELSAIQ